MNNERGSDSAGTDEMRLSLDTHGNAVKKDPVYDLCHCSGIEPSLINHIVMIKSISINSNQYFLLLLPSSTSADFF
jgi:hypothetical protein